MRKGKSAPITEPGRLPVAVIGAGPVGLAAAAHLLERGLEPLVFEAGGEVAASVAAWGHVRVFSPWRFNIDRAAERLLAKLGWVAPDPDGYPTGAELRERYLNPLARTAELCNRIRLDARVTAIARLRHDKMKDAGRSEAPFELVVETTSGRQRILAHAVIDTSGSFANPNPLGASGIPADGEAELAKWIAYGLPNVLRDRRRYAGKRVLVVGSGHSAMNVIQDLIQLKADAPATEITWAIRRSGTAGLYGGGISDGLPERAALGAALSALVADGAAELVAGVEITALEQTPDGIAVHHHAGTLDSVDEIIAATGFRPELSILRELRLSLDPSVEAPLAIAPLIDPNVHSCGSVPPHGALELTHPETNFYIAGMKSYGRAPTFLMPTGYEQVRSIAAALAGDMEAATRVELVLPETGVCNGAPAPTTSVVGNGSGTASPRRGHNKPQVSSSACCSGQRDEEPIVGSPQGHRCT